MRTHKENRLNGMYTIFVYVNFDVNSWEILFLGLEEPLLCACKVVAGCVSHPFPICGHHHRKEL